MPTRSKHFLAGLLSGYGSIAASILYTMASIPLALHYLGKEEFGLWALALQINGYLALLDFGMSSAVSRFLADHKDDVDGGEYGSLLLTGGLVFAAQGAIIAVVGISFSGFAPAVFAIPTHLAGAFAGVLALQAALSGVSIAMRSIGSPLWAFQRMEVINICASVGLLLSLPLMWLGFRWGYGIYSLAYAGIPSILLTLVAYVWVCAKNNYYPKRGCWGAPRRNIFKQIFVFGRDVLLVTLGSQLINATQIMIISRVLGLDAAATFSVATKLYSMGQQVFHKVIESAAPGLTEIYVRGETTRFIQRYWDALGVTLALATLGAVGLAGFNATFVSVWTAGAISWTPTGDLLLALMLVLTSQTRNFVGLFGLTGSFRSVRMLYFAEGLAFIPLAILLSRQFGIPGVLVASLFAHLLITFPFSFRAALKVLINSKPIQPGALTSLVMIALASIAAWTGRAFHLSPPSMAALVVFIGLLTALLIWFFALTRPVQLRLQSSLFSALRPIRRFLG
jgi:O-antigen/teichoic acid export membrane protein